MHFNVFFSGVYYNHPYVAVIWRTRSGDGSSAMANSSQRCASTESDDVTAAAASAAVSLQVQSTLYSSSSVSDWNSSANSSPTHGEFCSWNRSALLLLSEPCVSLPYNQHRRHHFYCQLLKLLSPLQPSVLCFFLFYITVLSISTSLISGLLKHF